MALFCLNVRGQFHARPGIGTERKHLAWQLVGKGCLTFKLDNQMLPWLGTLDWCSPRVWEVVKNWTVCPGHRLPFSSKKRLFPPLSLLPPQGFCRGRTRMTTEMWAPLNRLSMKRPWSNVSLEPEGLLCDSVSVPCICHCYCSAASSLQLKYPIPMNLSASWLNKTAPLLVVRNASGGGAGKESKPLHRLALQLARADILSYVEAGNRACIGEGLPSYIQQRVNAKEVKSAPGVRGKA